MVTTALQNLLTEDADQFLFFGIPDLDFAGVVAGEEVIPIVGESHAGGQVFEIVDRFDTYNDFHGCELGIQWERHHRRWFIEALGKIALGNNHQVVDIFGNTVFTPRGANDGATGTGGLLAQRTNIGRHSRNDFAAIPELGITVGYHVTPRLSFTAGYSLLYWGRVMRPGEQIDLDINPDLLPPQRVPFVGAERPRFAFNGTDFWAQGFNLGFDYSW